MSISTSDLVTFAQALTADAKLQEAGCRAALSRAYYAAYHDCNAWHASLPLPGSLGSGIGAGIGMHEQLCLRLANPDVALPAGDKTKSRRRAYALRNLRDRRTQADYHLDEQISLADAGQAVVDAQTIIAIV